MAWHTQELTLTQFWHPPEPQHEGNRCLLKEDMAYFERRASWGGMPKAQCLELPARGWPKGVADAERLLDAPELDPTGSSRLTRRWSYEDGDSLDVARFYDGLACWRRPYRTPGGAGGRIKTVVAHASANCHTTAQELAWRAYALVRYVDALETAGYRVAVVAQYCAKDAYYGGHGWECLITVKQPEDPLDLSQVAAVLSAAAFRWYGFAWQATVNRKLWGHRGTDQERQPTEPNTVYLPGSVRDRASAERWLASPGATTVDERGN